MINSIINTLNITHRLKEIIFFKSIQNISLSNASLAIPLGRSYT